MKKKSIKLVALSLNKNTISNLQIGHIYGGDPRGNKGNGTKKDCTIRSTTYSIFTTSCIACPLPGNETNTL